jgi:hypothetical protein
MVIAAATDFIESWCPEGSLCEGQFEKLRDRPI